MDPVTQTVIDHSFHWLDALYTALALFIAGVTAYVPWGQWQERKHKEEIEKEKNAMRAQLEAEQAAKTKYVTVEDFRAFDKRNEEGHTTVARKLGEALEEFGQTREEVNKARLEVAGVKGTTDAILTILKNSKVFNPDDHKAA